MKTPTYVIPAHSLFRLIAAIGARLFLCALPICAASDPNPRGEGAST
jgi:hypothetical protein